MTYNRTGWSAELAKVRGDRAERSEIRFELLKGCSRLTANPPVVMGAWRGLSGRRYAVTLYALDAALALDALPAVLIATRPDAIGAPAIVDLFSGAAGDGTVAEFIARARALGADSLHIHRLAENAAERVAIVRDLTAPVQAAA